MSRSDGSTADYYELPEGATQLQDLISHRNLNAQLGEIFRACYRFGMADHSDQLRDAKKILFYARAEVERLEKLQPKEEPAASIDDESPRAQAIGQNGNTGEHYADSDGWISWDHCGECPVKNGTIVRLRFGDGEEREEDEPEDYCWDLETAGRRADKVIAYKVIACQ